MRKRTYESFEELMARVRELLEADGDESTLRLISNPENVARWMALGGMTKKEIERQVKKIRSKGGDLSDEAIMGRRKVTKRPWPACSRQGAPVGWIRVRRPAGRPTGYAAQPEIVGGT